MAEINVTDLTTGDVKGTGVFDELMKTTKAHIQEEYEKGRIKGTEYSTVYLGALQAVMDRSLQFLLQQQRTDLEAQLMAEQIATEKLQQAQITQQTDNLLAQKDQIEAQTALTHQQQNNLSAEALNIPKQGLVLDRQAEQAEAQTRLTVQQEANLVAEGLNIPKQGLILDAQKAQADSQTALIGEQINSEVKRNELNGLLDQEKAAVMANTDLTTQQTANLAAEALNIPKQGLMVDAQTAQAEQQTTNLVSEEMGIKAQTTLTNQQAANAVTENTVMEKQICKLEAEFDLLMEQKAKTINEAALLGQKKVTEEAQTQGGASGEANEITGVIGKQMALYREQTEGYQRNAEQKAAKLMIDTWNVRRTTDSTTEATEFNKLRDQEIGAVVAKLQAGIGV